MLIKQWVDHLNYPSGPWHDEPNRLEWEYHGSVCIIECCADGRLFGSVNQILVHKSTGHSPAIILPPHLKLGYIGVLDVAEILMDCIDKRVENESGRA